jgi:hypothetical protein
MVKAMFIQQLLVTPLFDNLTMIDYDDIIGVADRAQAMSNDEACSSFHQA